MTTTSNPIVSPNQHLRDYLSHYMKFEHSPHYAVMLSGRWGIGKTFQARRILNELLVDTGKRYVLVSLFGLKSPQEIDDALVAALYPWSDNDGMRIASAVGKAILKHAKFELPKIKSSDLVNRMSADVFVFDDLERCRMQVTDALGYINQLVERDGCKVLIIANEDEIADQESYGKSKEKLIGKTLVVEVDFESAFELFLTEIRDENSKIILNNFRSDIHDIQEQSAFRNLRILQQTMWDFERLYSLIDVRFRSNCDAMRHLLRLFFVLSIEYKAGKLSAVDISTRTNRGLIDAMRANKESSTLSTASQKYPGFYIYDSILSDVVATDILVRGVIEPEAVSVSLDESSWFAAKNEPSWRTVWYSSERSDDDVRAAASLMQEEFFARKYDKTGEFLHLFGQMLFLADIGFSGRNRSETVLDCKKYVADLRSQKRLEPIQEAILDDVRHGSYGGLGFSQNQTEDFRGLMRFVAAQRSEAEVDAFELEATTLIVLMESEPSEFVRQTTYGREGSGRFANRPVLAAADPGKFGDALIRLAPESYREVLLGLSSRYDMGRLSEGRELANERSWAISLEEHLNQQAESMECFARDRISKVLSWTIGEKLEELRKADAERATH